MEQTWTTLGLAVVLFVSTNVDDVFILLALFSDRSLTPTRIVVGHSLGMLALVLASVAGSVLAVAIAPEYVGLLGLVPLSIGLFQLVQRWRGKGDDDDHLPAIDRTRALARIVAVMLITIASGGDNIAVYVPAFATRDPVELWVVGSVFMLLTLVWCWMGYALVRHPRLGAPIRRYAAPLTPFIFILLGVFILVEAFS